MKRTVSFAMAATMACSVGMTAVNVSAASHNNANTTPPKLQKGVTLTMWDFFDTAKKNDAGRLVMQKVVSTWSKQTGVKVKFLGHPDSSNTKMCVDAPAGNGPDVIGVPHDQVSQMVNCKALAPVPTWAWPASLQSRYIKGALQATKLYGHYYSMPWAIETTGLWYNKALIPSSAFKTSGKAPLAWSKLLPKLKALNDPSAGKYGLGWPIDNFYFDYAFISNTGGYVFKFTKKGLDYKQVGLDTPGAIRGIQFLKDLSATGKYGLVPESFTGTNGGANAKSLFTSGKLAVYLTGPWDRQDMQTAGINFGFAPVPSIDGKHPAHPFSGLQVFSVNQYSKHKNEAFALLSYMTRAMQLPEFKQQGRIPVIKTILMSKTVQADPVSRGLATAALSAAPMPNIPEMQFVWAPIGNAIGLVVKGQMSASDAAHQAVAKIKADVAKAHGG